MNIYNNVLNNLDELKLEKIKSPYNRFNIILCVYH
jgi:hypothetical protein